MKAIRHWDVALVQVDKLPDGLKKSATKIFLAGKNNNHEISQWELYLEKDPNTLRDSQFHYGYLVAKNTTLIHNEHSPMSDENRNALIQDGVYALYKQKETTADWFKIVID